MATRLYELAKELNIDSKDLIAKAAEVGLAVRSSSSTLTPTDQATLRRIVGEGGVSTVAPPTQSNRRAPSPGPTTGRPTRSEQLPEWTRLFLDEGATTRGRAFPDEIEHAARLAKPWIDRWFDPKHAATWIAAIPAISAETAQELSRAGVTPNLAAHRVWYGKLHATRPMIGQRVLHGDLTADEAAEELRRAGFEVGA